MQYRKLGRTDLDVSAIGIGTEHLYRQPREMVVSVIRGAIEGGVNYFDLPFSLPDYLDNLCVAFRGYRDRVLLTGHLGSTVKDGQYYKSRNARRCETSLLDVLARLSIDHVDILFLHNFNSVNDWDKIVKPGGVLELAQRLREEGRARAIGISGHYNAVVERAIDSGLVDVVMFPINMFSHAMPGRKELLDRCLRQGIGLVAMKPFGGGRLLNQRGTFRVPGYQTSGEAFKARITAEITPVQCLSYTLAQVGVSLALAGVKSDPELAAALGTLQATEAERDFSGLLSDFGRYVEGECTYCSHCLPCPEVIDIAQVNRLLDLAEFGLTEDLHLAYGALAVKASACTECGVCEKRCPFGVQVVLRITQAAQLFEGRAL
jgi:predicted aldo/keto reductase-like oxidoreductase